MPKLDFESAYSVEGHGRVAWYILGYEMIRNEDYEWTGIEDQNRERVRCVMVGDDRVFTFDVTELTELREDEFCPGCGQIGCGAYR